LARLTVRVTPRAGRDAIDGFTTEGHLRVRVAAAPADGAANESLCRLLALRLGVRRSRVTIIGGAASRIKTIDVESIDETRLRARLEAQRATRE